LDEWSGEGFRQAVSGGQPTIWSLFGYIPSTITVSDLK
jgi:hypothetical protein